MKDTDTSNLTCSFLNITATYGSCAGMYTQILCSGGAWWRVVTETLVSILKNFLNQKHTKYYLVLPLLYWSTTHFFTVSVCVCKYIIVFFFCYGMSLGWLIALFTVEQIPQFCASIKIMNVQFWLFHIL